MTDTNDSIAAILADCRTIAVVGLSADPTRPSHGVARYMQANGYRIIPINPTYAGTHILNEHCYPTLTQAKATLAQEAVAIDLVDCFRRSEYIPPLVDEAIAIGARCIWMQLGIINEGAAIKARAAGLKVVMDLCIKIEHMRTH
jgi:predicted CoA-binding protein